MATLIFDLDGTLIDSAPDIHAASNTVLAEEGLAPMTLPEVRSFIGHGVPHLVACLLTAAGQDPAGPRHARLLARFTEIYEEAVNLTLPYPGVVAALEKLAADGHRLGLCTNKPLAPARAVLRHLDLLRFFAVVHGGDSHPLKKPDPAPLLAALAALGGGTALYIGDSEVDAECARRAGLSFALFTEGYRKAPVESLPHAAAFADFADLPALVAGLLAQPAAL